MPPIVRAAAFLLVVAATSATPAPARAQSDSLGLHATLAGWAEDAWLRLLDRDAARDGRLSDQGILQRFNPTIDPDYQINLIRARFGPLDDADWYSRTRGARYWGGSINTRDFAEGAEFKESVALGRRWSADVRFTKQDLPELTRSLVRIGFVRQSDAGFFSSIEGTLVPLKPSSDLEVGAGWRSPEGGREVGLYLAVLDAFSDLIYQDLKVLNAAADTALDYERQPVTVRTHADLRLARRWRVEAHAGVLLPATLRAYAQFAPDSGFRQAERYGFAGLLVEWQPWGGDRVTLGGFATYLRAVTDRTPLPDGRALDDFRLTERTLAAGGLVLARVAPGWVLAGWLERSARPERKLYRGVGPRPVANVDYEDVAWSGQLSLERRPERGFAGGVTYELDLRDVTRGAGQVPAREGSLARHNNEVRFEFGWRAARRWAFQLGLGLDLDPGIWPRGWFGGGHGRFQLYW